MRYIGDENGWVKQLECVKMELGAPDASGRRKPIPIKGSEFTIDVDSVIVAIGRTQTPSYKAQPKAYKSQSTARLLQMKTAKQAFQESLQAAT